MKDRELKKTIKNFKFYYCDFVSSNFKFEKLRLRTEKQSR